MTRPWTLTLCALAFAGLAAFHAPASPPPADARAPVVVTADVDHFWEAYDAITATADTARQAALLDRLFLQRGTPGLRALMERRGYTPESYLQAIRDYPRFWASVRPNTLRADEFAGDIEAGVERLRALYQALRPATVYFTVGALLTNGTTLHSLVLIGSESALADRTVVTDELPDRLGQNLRRLRSLEGRPAREDGVTSPPDW